MKATSWNVVGVVMGAVLVLMALSGMPLIFPQHVALAVGAVSIGLNLGVLYIAAHTEED